jgi:Tfp pilus assembly protein PilO
MADQNISYKIIERRQKMYIKAYAIFCAILLLGAGWYSYNKWNQYSSSLDSLQANTVTIEDLRDSSSNEKINYESSKPAFDEINKEIENRLSVIFPKTDAYTELTRQIDTFEESLSRRNDVFEISNIDFQDPKEDETYSILPLRMSIRSSAENFTKFLHLIENSGSLNDQARLMDISSIRLNFEESGSDTEVSKMINFSVQLNAYFQKINK